MLTLKRRAFSRKILYTAPEISVCMLPQSQASITVIVKALLTPGPVSFFPSKQQDEYWG
jgi:hypothetical protein